MAALRFLARTGLSLCAALVIASSAAWGQKSITVNALDFVRAAIASNNDALAREVLERLLAASPDDVETNFLMATLDAKDGKLEPAIARFRGILVDHPNLIRVRLDYAKALFDAGEDENAEYNFRLALDVDLPDPVRAQVMNYLHAIRQRRRWDFSVAVSVAPDTNINAGTGASEITLFGLPFIPSQEAQRKSGIGAVLSLQGEYRYPLGEEWRWRSNAGVWRNEYPGGHFDDMILRTEIGPQVLRAQWDASLLGVYTQRWYGNDPFDAGAGPRIEVNYHGFERVRLGGDIEYIRLAYHTETFQNGDTVTANFYPDFVLPPTAFIRPIVGFYRILAATPAFADKGYRLGLAYHRELPFGITVELQGEMFLSYYDGPNPFFGTTRRDQTTRVTGSIYRRDFIVFGFDPVLSLVWTRNASNQDLFAYTRQQLELGFTKEF